MLGLEGDRACPESHSSMPALGKGRETPTGGLGLSMLWPGLSPAPTPHAGLWMCQAEVHSDLSLSLQFLTCLFWPVLGVFLSTLSLPHYPLPRTSMHS